MIAPRSIPMQLLLIALACFVLRAGTIVVLRAWEHPSPLEHRQIALNLAAGEGFSFREFGSIGPTSVQTPPYPVILATLYRAIGSDTDGAHIAAMMLNALVAAITVPLIYVMLRRVRASRGVAMLSGTLFAIWPTQIYAAAVVQPVVLICALVVASVWLWRRAIHDDSLLSWIGYSLLATLAGWIEPVLLIPYVLSAGFILIAHPLERATRARNALILLGLMAIVIGPWAYRNRIVHDRLIVTTTTLWTNVWKGNNPHASGSDRLPADRAGPHETADARQIDRLPPETRAELRRQSEAERDQLFGRLARGWIGANPGKYLELSITRLAKTLWTDWHNQQSRNIANLISRSILLIATPIGLVLVIRSRWKIGLPMLLSVCALLVYTFTLTAARFAIPFEPFQIALLSATLFAIVRPGAPIMEETQRK
jgi:hypothetical protein